MSKFVVLLRHGIAEDKDPSKSDAVRRLTPAGHERMEKIAIALARVLPGAVAIHSSPLVRAVETARWVARAYGEANAITETPALAPGAAVAPFRELLERAAAGQIICVGHEPGLTEFMLALTSIRTVAAPSLKKGGFYGIRLAKSGEGFLEWMVPPAVLLGGS